MVGMRASVVWIGNSKGIRIPKPLLEMCHISGEVEIEPKGDSLVIHSIRRSPRAKWEESFRQMHARKEDRLLIRDTVDLDADDWKW